MSQKKPRLVIPDMESLAIQPAANPSVVDSYQRPGAPHIGGPAPTNPMLQLSDALSKIHKPLAAAAVDLHHTYTDEEMAKAEQWAAENREAANDLIKKGVIPPGASPYFERGAQRAILKQLGDEYYPAVLQKFNGPEGEEARSANDPAVMRKFLDDNYKSFSEEWLKGPKVNVLDLAEVFRPAIERTNAVMMREHANFRIKAVEREYEESVSVSSENIVSRAFENITALSTDEDRTTAISMAATEMTDLLDNNVTGFVKNGGTYERGNELIVDSVVAAMKKTRRPELGEVLMHIRTKVGQPIGKIAKYQEKILAAEEHLSSLQMREESHAHSKEGWPHERLAREQSEKVWARQDQQWEQSQAQFKQHQDEDEAYKVISRRVYEGLRDSDSERAVAVIDGALQVAEREIPDKVERLRGIVDAYHTRQSTITHDPVALDAFRAQMSINPSKLRHEQITAMVKAGQITGANGMALHDDLDRLQAQAEHPFLKQSEVDQLLKMVQKGSIHNPGDEFSAEGAVRQAQASGAFRDIAQAWIETHPKGSPAEFRVYMRSQVQPILEQTVEDYGTIQRGDRAKAAERAAKAREAKLNTVVEDVAAKKQTADEAKRQSELARLKQHESLPRMGGRTPDKDRPHMPNKIGDWLQGFTNNTKPKIAIKDYASLLSDQTKRAVEEATTLDEQRKILVGALGSEYLVRGQSRDVMREHIDKFLDALSKHKSAK